MTMATSKDVMGSQTLDHLLGHLEDLKEVPELQSSATLFLENNYGAILQAEHAQALLARLITNLDLDLEWSTTTQLQLDKLSDTEVIQVLLVGLSAINAFLQANVTGPPLETSRSLLFPPTLENQKVSAIRKKCLQSLTVDGVSVYQLIPHIELFSLARLIFESVFPYTSTSGKRFDSRWMRIRLNFYHQRQLSGARLGVSDAVSTLQAKIEGDLAELEREILDPSSQYATEAKVQFLLEKAQIYILQGSDAKARENIDLAKTASKFNYVLSGALGKRTKFQQNEVSQLVVFAKSRPDDSRDSIGDVSKKLADSNITNGPEALELNDDTLLESIDFAKQENGHADLPPEFSGLLPDQQPQLKPLDQILLLAEATFRDSMAPVNKLDNEEVLPYATRVLQDKPTNWQVHTQALLVRSRIEAHRSRTMERSVLQLQALVDQIVAEIDNPQQSASLPEAVPEIKITSFLPKAKPSESAPINERLRYLFQLNTPTRWELETELAYAWSHAGSLVSALEIFKRLHLWAEVALCYHSIDQEDKARMIIRRQLFYSSKGAEMDRYSPDDREFLEEKWDGEIRPEPPHAPRYWCILGDLDQDPSCWERAWEISNKRYARAQRTLGEYYSKRGEFSKARGAYMEAAKVNRHNPETWSRLGDIDLREGNWDGAILAFQQAIRLEDDDAKTFNNLGSALLSKYEELRELEKLVKIAEENDEEEAELKNTLNKTSSEDILRQALSAFKRGASIAGDNWRIWDNVITIAGRMKPPSFTDILMGMRFIVRIRSPTLGEQAVDADILRGLIGEIASRERPDNAAEPGEVYLPVRGSLPRAVIDFVDQEIKPLITHRPVLWAMMEKLALYRQDYEEALACAEKSWRVAVAGEEWLQKEDDWHAVVEASEGLVSALENYGPQEKRNGEGLVEKSWKMKARSAVRGILSKGKMSWEYTAEYEGLQTRLKEVNNA